MNRLQTFRTFALAVSLLFMSGCCLLGGSGSCFGPVEESEADRAARTIKNFALSNLVSAGYDRTCARTFEAVFCWGTNAYGLLGTGSITEQSAVPLAVALPGGGAGSRSVHTVFSGIAHSCSTFSLEGVSSLRQALYCWGANTTRQLGDLTDIDREKPVPVKFPGNFTLQGILKVEGGIGHTCALQGDLTKPREFGGDEPTRLICWGANENGQVTGFSRIEPELPQEIQFLPSVHDFAAGAHHTCAITDDKEVMCWGKNPVTGAVTQATTVDGLSDVAGITAGFDHTCAFKKNGETFCWGANDKGQLGDGTTTARSVPTLVSGVSPPVEMAAGYKFTCARGVRSAQCWGANESGQLGNGTKLMSSVPVDVEGAKSLVSSISAGFQHACMKSNKSVFDSSSGLVCWGSGSSGQLGDGLALGNVPFDPALNPFILVAVQGAGSGSAAAAPGLALPSPQVLVASVQVENARLQVSPASRGFQQSPSWSRPVSVVGFSQNLGAVDAGKNHSCLITADGRPWCWGSNQYGEVGNNALGVDQPTPVTPAGLESGVVSIAVGGNYDRGHTCAVDLEGDVWCWGSNSAYQLGDSTRPTNQPSPIPLQVEGLSGPAVQVAAGTYDTCALIDDGTVQCWGDFVQTPTTEPGLTDAIQVAVGEFHLCVLKSTGKAECIGNISTGAIGNTCAPTDFECREEVTGLSGLVGVAAGMFSSCALTDDGGVWCWGSNPGDGQCLSSQNIPVQPIGLDSGVTSISSGAEHICVVKGEQGALYCWGREIEGNLGFQPSNICGPSTAAIEPTLVPGFESGVTEVAAGRGHTCVIIDDELQCFGSNVSGQLATESIGDVVQAPAPAITVGDRRGGETFGLNAPPKIETFDIVRGVVSSPFSVPATEWLGGSAPQGVEFAFVVYDPDGVLKPLDESADVQLAQGIARVAVDPDTGDLLLNPAGIAGAAVINVIAMNEGGSAYGGSKHSAEQTMRVFFGTGADLRLTQDHLVDGVSSGTYDFGYGPISNVTSIDVDALTSLSGLGAGPPVSETEVDVVYEVVNEGPIDLVGAGFTAAYSSGFPTSGTESLNWTCATGNGGCSPASGSGDVATTFDLVEGEKAIIRITGTLNGDVDFVGLDAAASLPDGVPGFLEGDDEVNVVVPLGDGFTLLAGIAGSGVGTVTGNPAGISCPGDCAKGYDYETEVTLTATPGPDSAFAGWSGACTNPVGDCVVRLSENRNVTANFLFVPSTPLIFTDGFEPAD